MVYWDKRFWLWLEQVRHEIQFSARTLFKSPGFSLIAILTLALGIGANTAVFTIVGSVLLRPLPFPESDRLFLISYKPQGLLFDPGPIMVDSSYLAFRKQNHTFESLFAVGGGRHTLTGHGDPVMLKALEVGPDFLRVCCACTLLSAASFFRKGKRTRTPCC
jgi:hypothetical protein